MELRSFNVQEIYKDCVRVSIKDTIEVTNVKNFAKHKVNIQAMVEQLPDNTTLDKCHIRKDGEQWTPYLQIVKMIVLMGIHIGEIEEVELPLQPKTIITKTRK